MADYDVLVIGGGIAGLAAATLFARAGYSVAVFEKDDYPRHRVCGEYISRESLPFLQDLGLEALREPLPQINRFQLTTSRGQALEIPLPLGGFGLSRYAFDAGLAHCAYQAGAKLHTRTKVSDCVLEKEGFSAKTPVGTVSGKLVIGSWGKKSNLDVQLSRPFLRRQLPVLDDWVGIKHHIRYEAHPEHLIALHSFPGGYCGISRVEAGRTCLCYLVHKKQLQKAGNRIPNLEATVLAQNPALKTIWQEAEFLYEQPLAISGISFQQRSAVVAGILCCGDSAGMIPPLSGNGMSMALHSAQMAFRHGQDFLSGKISRLALESAYTQDWNRQFRRRLWVGRQLQAHMGNEALLHPVVRLLRAFPFAGPALVRTTHGQSF